MKQRAIEGKYFRKCEARNQDTYLPQFNKPDVNRGDLSSRAENMYEILKDISSELHNIRVSN